MFHQGPCLFVGWGCRCYHVIIRETHRTGLFVSIRYPPTIVCISGQIDEDRCCFHGIERTADRLRLWDHLPQTQRARAIESERRAYYDIIDYGSILDHTNITVDPSTGHMLQTIQMI